MSLKSSIPSTFFKISRQVPIYFEHLLKPFQNYQLVEIRLQPFCLNPYRYGCIEKVKVKYCFKDTCVCVFDVLDP